MYDKMCQGTIKKVKYRWEWISRGRNNDSLTNLMKGYGMMQLTQNPIKQLSNDDKDPKKLQITILIFNRKEK